MQAGVTARHAGAGRVPLVGQHRPGERMRLAGAVVETGAMASMPIVSFTPNANVTRLPGGGRCVVGTIGPTGRRRWGPPCCLTTAEYEQAIGLDWYRLDPQPGLPPRPPPPHDPADRILRRGARGPCGPLVGGRLAARAEETDAHGPVLRSYDHWGTEVGEVVHHATWLENKADLV